MKNLPFRSGELSLEEIKEQKDINNMTIKMSDLQAKSTPPEGSPSNVQKTPNNVQNSQTDEEGEKSSKMGSDLQAKSTPTAGSPSNVQNPPSNVQNPPSNVQNSQTDEEGEKSSKIGSTSSISISSKSSLLEDSQRFAFFYQTLMCLISTSIMS